MNIDRLDYWDASRLESERYNQATSARHMDNEIRFSFYNHASILQAIKEGRAQDLAALGKPGEGKPLMILASGISLNEVLPMLKDWPYPIMCSSSHAATCIYHGREPEYVIGLDPDTNPSEFDADTWKGRKTALVMQPGINPHLLEFWKGPILLFRKLQPQTPFYDGPQKIGYSTLGKQEIMRDLGTEITGRYTGEEAVSLINCVIPMLGCVLAAEICIAKQLGFDRIYMMGADFQYTRFTRWHYRSDTWVEDAPAPLPELLRRWTDNEVPITSGERIIHLPSGNYSTPLTIFYAHQVVTAWRITECDVINCSPNSELKVMPFADAKEVIRKKGEGFKGMSKPDIIDAAEEYLARINIYFFNIGRGIMPREFHDPLTEIPRGLKEVKIAMEQQGKGNEIDVEANMKRVRRLWEKVIAGYAS